MDGLDDEMRYDDVCFLLCLDLDIWIWHFDEGF
jgi:hypothetical protein